MNFNYFVSDTVVDYLVEAVRMVARDGWRLLGDYRFEVATGLWRHRDGLVEPPLSLRQVSYAGGVPHMPQHRERGGEEMLAEHLREARKVFEAASGADLPDLDEHPGQVSADFEHLRWFDLPRPCLA